jgi:ornithine cyclodeaminase/alanine dehydrogenase-like protein (mu-crystallin family)
MQNQGEALPEPVLVLNRTDVLSLFTWPGLIDAARRALVQDANASTAERVPGVSAQVALPAAALHLKAGVQSVPPMMSVKANLRPHAGSSSGAVLVFDLGQQRMRAIVASADVTALRTAAIAGVAASHLLAGSAAAVAILGAGPVGRRIDEALAHLGVASEVRWWSREPANAVAAVSEARGDVPHVAADSVAAAVAGAGLVVTCTPARDPILFVDDLDPDAVVLAMGADTPGKRELGPGVLDTAGEIYADIPDDALTAGEAAYLSTEDASRIRPLGLLLAADAAPNRPSGNRARVVFDSVGSSTVDAATMALLIEAAADAGLGGRIDLEA